MEKKTSCIIIGAAPGMPLAWLDRALIARSEIIAADGGYQTAQRAGLTVEFWVGDADSAGDVPDAPGLFCERLPCEKDFGDVHTAVERALARGMREIVLVGCSGGRLDHFLADVALLERIERAGAHGELRDAQNRLFFLAPGRHIVPRDAAFSYLSLLALDETLTGVTLSGVKYPLAGATLRREMPIGISNEWTADEAEIVISSGRALCVLSRDLRGILDKDR